MIYLLTPASLSSSTAPVEQSAFLSLLFPLFVCFSSRPTRSTKTMVPNQRDGGRGSGPKKQRPSHGYIPLPNHSENNFPQKPAAPPKRRNPHSVRKDDPGFQPLMGDMEASDGAESWTMMSLGNKPNNKLQTGRTVSPRNCTYFFFAHSGLWSFKRTPADSLTNTCLVLSFQQPPRRTNTAFLSTPTARRIKLRVLGRATGRH